MGHFISLNKDAKYWADKILESTQKDMLTGADKSESVRVAGFDSSREAAKLLAYYQKVFDSNELSNENNVTQ